MGKQHILNPSSLFRRQKQVDLCEFQARQSYGHSETLSQKASKNEEGRCAKEMARLLRALVALSEPQVRFPGHNGCESSFSSGLHWHQDTHMRHRHT